MAFEIGTKVKHKSDDRVMVVIDYGKPANDMRIDAKDPNQPICRYINPISGRYEAIQFIAAELEAV